MIFNRIFQKIADNFRFWDPVGASDFSAGDFPLMEQLVGGFFADTEDCTQIMDI